MLLVKNLERHALRLGENGSPNLCIGESPPSLSFVYESMPVEIDHYPEGIRIAAPEISSGIGTGDVERWTIQILR